ncbi:PIN domain-like protein, partial [Trametes maxima]
HAQAGENPELRAFFYRLAMLAERPMHLIFVADGPLRPKVKRGKQVKVSPHWLTEGMQRFVEAFGFGWVVAAGEAEAELAKMNALNVIDAIMTEDGDAFLHGARRSKPDDVEIYRSKAIFEKRGISQGDFILLALLVGCDYNMVGLRRCGIRTAKGLIKYGLGRNLYAATLTYTGRELAEFLTRWRGRVQEILRTDPRGFIGRAHPALASSIPHTFPDVELLHLLTSPALSGPRAYVAATVSCPLDIARIGSLCELYFTWGNRAEILKTLRTSVWVDEVVRMLIAEASTRNGNTSANLVWLSRRLPFACS